jgi:hypothetical protein
VVHTELGSGLAETRSFKAVEPEDVAVAIVDALHRNRYEVFVPKSMGSILRPKGMLPIRAVDALGRLFKGDQVLMRPDRERRAAYEARVAAEVQRVPSATAGNSDAPGELHATDQAAQPQTEAATGTAGIR